MRSITCAGVDVASKGKLMSTSRRFPASVARRMSSTLRSLKPSRPSFLQKRCTLATETLVRAANSLMESPRMSSPMARAEMPSCCSVGVRPCASVILRLISIRTPTLGKPAKKGQVYFGTFRSVSGSVRDGRRQDSRTKRSVGFGAPASAHPVRRRYSAYRPAMQRRCSSQERYREGLAIRALALAI